ncbi:glycosyltransferase family 4 protein [Phnomibacter sp. MR]|uniref:glycosyltransferase family 4 protein n=1 Tax=Phnomibacter sp. MR TaxID=3042318 RepID=UPI003A80C3C2
MKIVVISIINEPWGGSEELWAAMADIALENGHAVIHSAYNCGTISSKEKALVAKGLKVLLRPGFAPANTTGILRFFNKAKNKVIEKLFPSGKAILRLQPDLILYVGTGLSAKDHPSMVQPLIHAGIPFVINYQLNQEGARFLSESDMSLLQYVVNHAAGNFFVSQRNWEALEKMLAIKIPKASIIRNPVNMPDTSALPFPPFQKGVVQLAMVGNLLVMHKGQDTMLQTLAQPAWRNLPWHLNVYGQGMDQPYLEQLATMYGIAEKISFHGRVADIRQLWSQNHLLLMPSVMEGMPLAVVEAMLCGRPALATDVGGHTEWITDNVDGFVAAAPSVQCLSDALQRAWQRQHEWARIGQMAHEKALQLYDPQPGQTLLTQLERIVAAH